MATKQISLYLGDPLFARVRRAADRAGVGTSVWIRDLIISKLDAPRRHRWRNSLGEKPTGHDSGWCINAGCVVSMGWDQRGMIFFVPARGRTVSFQELGGRTPRVGAPDPEYDRLMGLIP